ncbi:hypothetical protein KM043_011724 [Ampulex compressa]|uniref:phospholipase A2 n=1 Tax=Ampulex compressa TaxID=860918 RepID=A0A1W6EW03_AMPCP|nr:phospholipase A2 -like protein 2 [Ampulex compressa]KAG7210163.1 hypothetical protein KM043_011724 [Ampulex compressa]
MALQRNFVHFLILSLSVSVITVSSNGIIDSVIHRFKYRKELVFPDAVVSVTKWCGKVSRAKDFQDLGKAPETDRCCRQLVQCEDVIAPLTYKYGVYNDKKYFAIDCNCTQKFRACLRNIKSLEKGISYKLGNEYFHQFRPDCFLKTYKMVPGIHVYYDKSENRYTTNEGGKYFMVRLTKVEKWM